ncbi:MAG: DUF4276 family protein [Thermodesulfobacteriota bacterium]|nr:DUF4276 family protein [Thermodesulfobacteriota bacterium]
MRERHSAVDTGIFYTFFHFALTDTLFSLHHAVVNRLAIEELEAWFFGDPEALVQAYPRVPKTIGKRASFRKPDAIAGGTWEALERVLKKASYYPNGISKVETARNISRYMEPNRNSSKSFQVFRDALSELNA